MWGWGPVPPEAPPVALAPLGLHAGTWLAWPGAQSEGTGVDSAPLARRRRLRPGAAGRGGAAAPFAGSGRGTGSGPHNLGRDAGAGPKPGPGPWLLGSWSFSPAWRLDGTSSLGAPNPPAQRIAEPGLSGSRKMGG